MNKFVALYTACSLLVLLIASQAAEDNLVHDEDSGGHFSNVRNVDPEDDMLDSELEFKRMINLVSPLFSIFSTKRKRRSMSHEGDEDYHHHEEDIDYNHQVEDDTELVETARARGSRRPAVVPGDRSGYGEYAAASGGYHQSHSCCDSKKDDLLPILALSALSLLLLYLIAIATTTTTRAGRRKRSEDDNEIIDGQAEEIGIITIKQGISKCLCGTFT